jgi:uncharacterized membrane protein
MLPTLNFSAEKIFLLFVVIFGLGFLFFVPPFQAPDEYQHFSRAYVVSEGHLLASEGYIPQGIVDLMAVTQGVPFHPEKKVNLRDLASSYGRPLRQSDPVHTDFPASAVYSPLPYLVSASGIFVGRTLDTSPLVIFYLGRVFNLAVWAYLTYLALRLTPVFKWTFLLLFLSPMSLNQAVSYSADSLTNALSFFAIGYCLYLALTTESILNLKDLLPLFALAILMPLTKPPYAALIGLMFLIPVKKFGSLKKYLLVGFLLISIAGILVLVGISINRGYYYRFVPYPGVNANDQIAYILHRPLAYLGTILRTFFSDFGFMSLSYVGVLGWLDTKLPWFIYITFYLVILFVALIDNYMGISLTYLQKLFLAIIGVSAFLLVATGQYLTWTPVGASKINAIQGRYLIPVVPILILLLYNQRFRVKEFVPRSLASLYLVLILATTIYTLFIRYYQL